MVDIIQSIPSASWGSGSPLQDRPPGIYGQRDLDWRFPMMVNTVWVVGAATWIFGDSWFCPEQPIVGTICSSHHQVTLDTFNHATVTAVPTLPKDFIQFQGLPMAHQWLVEQACLPNIGFSVNLVTTTAAKVIATWSQRNRLLSKRVWAFSSLEAHLDERRS